MMAHEIVLERLRGVRPSGDGWTAVCPAHDDRTPSLSIALGDDGRVLLYCFAGCTADDVARAIGLGMRDLYAGDPDRDRLSREDRELIRRRADEARAARLVETSQRHEEARQRACRIWNAALPADALHPYLKRKGVPAGVARQRGDSLVLPVMDLASRLHSLQFIGPDGEKIFLRGGRKKGNVIPVAGRMPNASRILICEGWATGQTLATMDPDALVLAAIDAGNLEPVARAVRSRWPRVEIVICADADPVGISRGRAAALAAGAQIAIPEFPAGVDGSDWNDLAVWSRQVAA